LTQGLYLMTILLDYTYYMYSTVLFALFTCIVQYCVHVLHAMY